MARADTTVADAAPTTNTIRHFYFLRDYEAGISEGERRLGDGTGETEQRAWYVACLARGGQPDEALAQAQRMIDAAPDDAWSRFAYAAALNWADGRGEEALAASAKALDMMPHHTDFQYLREEVLRQQEGNAAALDYIDTLPPAVQEKPIFVVRKATAMFLQAQEAGDSTAMETAFDLFAHARALAPGDVESHYLPGYYRTTMKRIPEALRLLERAAELTPAAAVHQSYWWAVRSEPETTAEQRLARIEADIERLLERGRPSPAQLQAVANVYHEMGLPEARDRYEDRLLEEYNDSSAAEWVLVNRYRRLSRSMYETEQQTGERDEETVRELCETVEAFIDRPQHHNKNLLGDAYRTLFLAMRRDSTADADELLAAIHGMEQYETNNPHIVYSAAPTTLADRGVHLDEAERIARQGLVAARRKVDELKALGAFETEGDYRQSLDQYTAAMRDALGWVLLKKGDLCGAGRELLSAGGLDARNVWVRYHLGRMHEWLHAHARDGLGGCDSLTTLAHLDEAESYYIKGTLIETPFQNPNEEALRELYEKREGGLDGYEDYLASIADRDRERRRREIISARTASPQEAATFTMRSLDNETVSLDAFAGKIVVINFWATWCGPCVSEMPDFQEFARAYRDDADVVVLTINNDFASDTARRWIEKHGYDFPVLCDDGYTSKVGVTAIPTTWFLDRQGRLAFEKVGWSEHLGEEFAWRVEALKED